MWCLALAAACGGSTLLQPGRNVETPLLVHSLHPPATGAALSNAVCEFSCACCRASTAAAADALCAFLLQSPADTTAAPDGDDVLRAFGGSAVNGFAAVQVWGLDWLLASQAEAREHAAPSPLAPPQAVGVCVTIAPSCSLRHAPHRLAWPAAMTQSWQHPCEWPAPSCSCWRGAGWQQLRAAAGRRVCTGCRRPAAAAA